MKGDLVEVSEIAACLWLVTVHGEHDLSNVSELDDAIGGVFRAGSRVVVDLSEASFIDSSILGSLLRGRQKADGDVSHELVIVAPVGTSPRRLIDITGVAGCLPIFESREAALDAFA